MSSSGPEASAGKPASSALQVIVLGSGGGPQEFNTTAFLVRSTAEGWRRGSIVALDAGVLLSSITRILEQTLPPGLGETGSTAEDEEGETPDPSPLSLPYTLTTGPFAGLEVPHATAGANASFIQSALVDTYLITHPHLDHISGFVINTAGLPGTRPKRLAGLPSTISAFKTHIFNNIIWPNLSDENNGAGLVTFMRLVEGGSPALGDGDGRGYVEISDGLAVKIWGVSHGHCIERHSHRGSGTSTRFGSVDAGSGSLNAGLLSPRITAHHSVTSAGLTSYSQPPSSSPLASQAQQIGPPAQPLQSQSHPQTPQLGPQRRDSLAMLSGITGAAAARRASLSMPSAPSPSESICVYDSSAYFIRDMKTGREVLMFGDVEPDSVSLSPRNGLVWQEAAPKIAAGNLAAIFVECSYDDSQPLDRLYGHLTPRFVAEEMANLAAEVKEARMLYRQQQVDRKEQQEQQRQRQLRDREGRKRKRYGGDDERMSISNTSRTASHSRRKTEAQSSEIEETSGTGETRIHDDPVSPRTVKPQRTSVASVESSILSTSSSAAIEGGGTATPTATTTTTPHVATPTAELSLAEAELAARPAIATVGPRAESDTIVGSVGSEDPSESKLPLQGLKVVIIHVKEKLKDGPPAGDIILDQLREHEARNPLGCEYIISHAGQSFLF